MVLTRPVKRYNRSTSTSKTTGCHALVFVSMRYHLRHADEDDGMAPTFSYDTTKLNKPAPLPFKESVDAT